jgi:hypothetical protein
LLFFFAVRFDRQYDPAADVIRLQFGFGECWSQQVRHKSDFILRQYTRVSIHRLIFRLFSDLCLFSCFSHTALIVVMILWMMNWN